MLPDTELLVYDGGAVKSLDDKGRIGGHLILWGDEKTPDATAWKDYFTPETDLGRFIKAGPIDLIFHHDLPTIGKAKDGSELVNHLAGRELGEMKAHADDKGLWVEGLMHVRDEYEEAVKDMVAKGKLSWSSGAVSHRVIREKQANGSHKMKRWHVVEASLTPTPGEPRTQAVALKALLDTPQDEGSGAALTLWDRFSRLVADQEEIVPLVVKAAEQRIEAGRKVSPERLAALKAFHDRTTRLLVAVGGPDPAEREALKRRNEALLQRLGKA